MMTGSDAPFVSLTASVPAEHKFKIYISALTQLNIDSNNRISTTDNRLIRRMVRDNNFRSHSALKTLQMWPKVRRGEKTWIFPFQKEADVAFNSALDYELAVLRPYAEPLLAEIKPSMPEYAEAVRIQQAQADYIKQVSGSGDPAAQIAQAKKLHDDGVISAAEFEQLKAKALS